jgi:hypothetical protein
VFVGHYGVSFCSEAGGASNTRPLSERRDPRMQPPGWRARVAIGSELVSWWAQALIPST